MNGAVVAGARMIRLSRLASGLALLLACCACSTDSTRWARGPYVELKTYTSVEFRRGPTTIDPRTGELTIAWVGARAPEGDPRILECHLYVFDDRNGNGERDSGEILQERWSHEVSRKVIFGDVHVLLSAATGTLMATMELNTERRHRGVTWRLVPD